MFNNENPDQDTTLLVVVSVNGGVCSVAYTAKQSLSILKELPTWNVSVEQKPNNYNPLILSTQFILKKLGTPDKRSVEQQIGPFIRKNGASYPPKGTFQDWICAAVMSRIHDRVGSLDGVSFSYSDNTQSFVAKFQREANKFVVS